MTDIPLWNYVIYAMTGASQSPSLTAHGALRASSSSEAEATALMLLEGHVEDEFPVRTAVAGGEYQPGHFLVDVILQRA